MREKADKVVWESTTLNLTVKTKQKKPQNLTVGWKSQWTI